MHTSCHRCGGDLTVLDGATSFCPHCGAPQIYLRENLLEDMPTDSTGNAPPPSVCGVEWQPAIRAAGFVALVAPALCLLGSVLGAFSLLGFLWIVGASTIAIGLYHRQRPGAYMDAGTGARIGVLVGAMMATALGLTFALAGLVARFGLHRMGSFDHDLSANLHAQVDLMVAQAAQTNPIPPWLIAIFLSPEFRAGIGLTSVAMFATALLAISTAFGAFAGSIGTSARRNA